MMADVYDQMKDVFHGGSTHADHMDHVEHNVTSFDPVTFDEFAQRFDTFERLKFVTKTI